MKNIMMVVSVLFTICFVIVILGLAGVGGDIAVISGSILVLFLTNIIPILTIAVCCFALERNDQNYFLRIIPIYMLVPIVLSSVMLIFKFDTETAGFLSKIVSFILSTASPLFILTILFTVKSNNSISKIFRTLAFGAIAVTFLCTAFTQITKFFEDKLPNIYEYDGYGGFNFTESSEALQFQQKVAIYSTVTEIFSVLMLFITNYAFSSKVEYEADEIDYDKIKETANNISTNRMQNKYNVNNLNSATPVVSQTTNNNQKGLMNIDNQLGVESKVGKVSEAASETMIENSSIDSIIPLSNGPVINNTIKNEEIVETPVQEINQHNQATPVLDQQAVVQNGGVTTTPTSGNSGISIPQQNANMLQATSPVLNTPVNNQNIGTVSSSVNSNNVALPSTNMVQGNGTIPNNQIVNQSGGPVLNNTQVPTNTSQQSTTSQNKFI